MLVPIGLVTTTRTRLTRVGATGRNDLWRWQVCNCGHPFGGIGSIRPRTKHGWLLRAHMLGPALYDKCPTGAIPRPGIDAIVSKHPLSGVVCLLTTRGLIRVRCSLDWDAEAVRSKAVPA